MILKNKKKSLSQVKQSLQQGRIQKFSKGGADKKNQAKGGADGTKLRTFRRKLLGKRAKSNPKVGAAAPSAAPLDPPLPCSRIPK
jgi:hypothetical protein